MIKRPRQDRGFRGTAIGAFTALLVGEALRNRAPARRGGAMEKSRRQTRVERSWTMSRTYETLSEQKEALSEQSEQKKKQEVATVASPPTVPETPEDLLAELQRIRESVARLGRPSFFFGRFLKFVKGD